MVFLKRLRNLSLKRLEEKPTENLSMVHAILSKAVEEVLEKLKRLEQLYYGKRRDQMDEIKKWGGYVKTVIVAAHVGVFKCAEQLEDITRNANDPSKKFKIDMFQLNKTKEIVRKVQDFMPHKFKEVSEDMKSILEYLLKYCLSFYDPKSEVAFETGKEYEEKRMEWMQTMNECLSSVTDLPRKFRKESLEVQDFSAYGKELGQKVGTYQCMFLVMFPEICENMRLACKAAKLWIEADRSYALFISYDLTDLEIKKDSFLKSMRDLQQRYASLCFG